MANPVWDLIDRRAQRRPADPVVTFIGADGTRTELSGRTLANNVAKAAGALRDDGMVDIGSSVTIDIGWHWQRAVWALACWSVGAIIGPDGDVHLADPEHAGTVDGAVRHRAHWLVSMHPFGLPNAEVPDGMSDAAILARLQPDDLLADDVPADAAALLDDGTEWTVDDLLASAAGLTQREGVRSGERVAVPPVLAPEGWAWFLVPLLADASLVLIGTGVDPDRAVAAESARVITSAT